MLIMITYKKSTPQVYNLLRLKLMNLDKTYKYLKHFKETEYFQKKENSSNI